MKYTREMLEKMPLMRLRKAAKEAGLTLLEIMKMSTHELIEEILSKDGCDHDCANCDAHQIKSLVPKMLEDNNPFEGFAQQMRSFVNQSRQRAQPQMQVFHANSMAEVAKKIVELQQDVIQPRQLADMLLKIPHPKLKTTPFWHIHIDPPVQILDCATVVCGIDPLVFEAASFTMKELKSMMTKEIEELRPYLPPDLEFKVKVVKEIKQVLGYLPIKPAR